MGDEVQAIKAGLLEVADIVVVNKGDRPGRAANGVAAPGDARRGGPGRRPIDRQARPAPGAARAPATEGARGPRDHRDDGRGDPGAARVARPAPRARPRGERHAGPARAGRGAGLGDPRRPPPRRPPHAGEPRRRPGGHAARGRRARAGPVRARRTGSSTRCTGSDARDGTDSPAAAPPPRVASSPGRSSPCRRPSLVFFVSGGCSCRSCRGSRGPLGGDASRSASSLGAVRVSSLVMRPFAGRLADRFGAAGSRSSSAPLITVAALVRPPARRHASSC